LETINLIIDNKSVAVPPGKTILEAALGAGIYIPHLCYLPGLRPYAGCRLCLVEIEGWRKKGELITACTQPAAAGMVVHTDTPEVVSTRRQVLELILSDHPDRCLTCPRRVRCSLFDACKRDLAVTDRCVICAKNGLCELQQVVDFVGVTQQRFYGVSREYALERTNPFIERDWNKCISCGRCVRACVEIRGVGAIDFAYRGKRALVTTPFDVEMKDTNCEFDGGCVLVCPTGALMDRVNKYAGRPDRSCSTICSYCGVGCGLRLNIKGDKIIGAVPDVASPVNSNCLCVKGRYAYDYVQSPARLSAPLVRRPAGAPAKTTWDQALSIVVQRLHEIKVQYGPDAIGIIASAKCTNEENYLAQKLARAVIGTNNVDSCAALCHKPTLEGLQAAFGWGAMTNSIPDIEKAGCIFVIGSNTTETHPIVALRIKWAVKKGAKLIVANPREIDLCRFAHLWLRHQPGSDVALINGLTRVIVEEELWDSAFVSQNCTGLDPLIASLQAYSPEQVSKITGVPTQDIVMAARLIATGGRHPGYVMPPVYYRLMEEVGIQGETAHTSIIYGTGITHHANAIDGVRALANLAMLTGDLGVAGGGLNPLAGQNNMQGACDMGALPNYLPGYQSLADPEVCAKFAAAWNSELPERAGLTLTGMLAAAHQGSLKALYVIGENPMLAAPDLNFVQEALQKLDFLVVQDIFFTETAQLADVVLPGVSFAEKDGTFTNTERRVQRVYKALEPVGDSKPDWWIITELARRLQQISKPPVPASDSSLRSFADWDYIHPATVMSEIATLTPLYGGISYDRLEKGGLQWPCYSLSEPGTPILYAGGFGERKGQFLPVEYRPPAEQPDAEYPLLLTTGRILFHYHAGRLTMHSKGLMAIRPEGYAELHPDDARPLNITDDDLIKISSRRGQVVTKARLNEAALPGTVFMTIHYAESAVNCLMGRPAGDDGHMPELKYCPVRVEKYTPPKK